MLRSTKRRWNTVRWGLLCAGVLSACHGGGGGSAGSTQQPTIQALLVSFPTGASPTGFVDPGFNTAVSVAVLDQAGATPITNASVRLNGVVLQYSATYGDYANELSVDPGAAVNLSVNVNGATYSATAQQFYAYPNIIAPAANTTWSSQTTNIVSWSATPPSATAQYAYPVIADGKVFVVASDYGRAVSLYALDETNGVVVWGPVDIPGTYFWASHAYDHGKPFVVSFDGKLRAFDAATGAPGWERQLPGQYAFSSSPTAANGVVYVGGAGSAGTLYAVDEANGELLWTAPVWNGDQSSPAVSSDGVFVSYPCQVYKFDPLVGTQLWRYAGPCEGGGGKTAAFGDGRLYVRDPTNLPNKIYDAGTGAEIGTFVSTLIPALSESSAYYLNADSSTLTAVDAATQSPRWMFMGDGNLQVAPIVIDGVVVVGSGSGTVYALRADTGASLWSGQAGAPITRPDEHNVRELVGLGAGDGYLVVPATNVVKAWRISQ